jgi:UDP-N-acetylglucosamine:LPS N-acetylglucosamine transferase
MRSANLARAIQAARRDAAVLVHVTHEGATAVCGGVPCVASDPSRPGEWSRLIAAFQPTLVVFDTMAPGAWAGDDTPRAFVWRRSVPERHAGLLADEQVRRARVYVIPHDREEFGYELPAALEARAVFTGPIVRQTDPAGQARVRARYGIAGATPIVTSTVGGGGFADSASWLLDVTVAAHDRLAARLRGLTHIVVNGPLASAAALGDPHADAARGLIVVDHEPDLVDLFALSRLVVSEAGYNTVQEIRQVGVPALLVPGERTFDDQAQRARALADEGLARMVDRRSKPAAADALVALALDDRALAAIRARLSASTPPAGNVRAAAALLAAA